jgi:hypothetical protein
MFITVFADSLPPGATCSDDNDCSDELVCNSNGICVDPNANNNPPYMVSLSCWNFTYGTTGPDCGHAHHVQCPGGALVTELALEIQGEHFNTGNVEIQVLNGPSIVYSGTVTAVAGNPGKLAGSFDVKTYVQCGQALEVELTDGCTGNVVQFSYPA